STRRSTSTACTGRTPSPARASRPPSSSSSSSRNSSPASTTIRCCATPRARRTSASTCERRDSAATSAEASPGLRGGSTRRSGGERRHLPRQAARQKDVEQVVLKVDVAGEPAVVLAEKEPVRDGDDAVFVLRRAGIERLARQERRLRDAAVARL